MMPFLRYIYFNLHLYKSGETELYTQFCSQLGADSIEQSRTYIQNQEFELKQQSFSPVYSIAANTDQKNNVKVDNKQNICSGRGYTFIFDTENFQDQGWNARMFGTCGRKKMFKYVQFLNCLVVLIWFARTLLSEVNKE